MLSFVNKQMMPYGGTKTHSIKFEKANISEASWPWAYFRHEPYFNVWLLN